MSVHIVVYYDSFSSKRGARATQGLLGKQFATVAVPEQADGSPFPTLLTTSARFVGRNGELPNVSADSFYKKISVFKVNINKYVSEMFANEATGGMPDVSSTTFIKYAKNVMTRPTFHEVSQDRVESISDFYAALARGFRVFRVYARTTKAKPLPENYSHFNLIHLVHCIEEPIEDPPVPEEKRAVEKNGYGVPTGTPRNVASQATRARRGHRFTPYTLPEFRDVGFAEPTEPQASRVAEDVNAAECTMLWGSTVPVAETVPGSGGISSPSKSVLLDTIERAGTVGAVFVFIKSVKMFSHCGTAFFIGPSIVVTALHVWTNAMKTAGSTTELYVVSCSGGRRITPLKSSELIYPPVTPVETNMDVAMFNVSQEDSLSADSTTFRLPVSAIPGEKKLFVSPDRSEYSSSQRVEVMICTPSKKSFRDLEGCRVNCKMYNLKVVSLTDNELRYRINEHDSALKVNTSGSPIYNPATGDLLALHSLPVDPNNRSVVKVYGGPRMDIVLDYGIVPHFAARFVPLILQSTMAVSLARDRVDKLKTCIQANYDVFIGGPSGAPLYGGGYVDQTEAESDDDSNAAPTDRKVILQQLDQLLDATEQSVANERLQWVVTHFSHLPCACLDSSSST